jgi:hypothetical protein
VGQNQEKRNLQLAPETEPILSLGGLDSVCSEPFQKFSDKDALEVSIVLPSHMFMEY